MNPAAGKPRSVGPFGVFPLCLGANVFGWTASERDAQEVLDAYVGVGGNFVDTADSYSHWVEGHVGGESETIIGGWLARRGRRDDIVLATKVGKKPGLERLDPTTMAVALDGSLSRLRTDVVDLWLLHYDDRETPLEATATAVGEQLRAGKVRAFGVCNFTAPRLEELIRVCDRVGIPAPVALQSHYNLMDRDRYEGRLAAVAARHGLAALPYFGLARGFLTGKYRLDGPPVNSPREPYAAAYLQDPRGPRVVGALAAIAARRGVAAGAVALAWLAAQPTVTAAVASARTVGQLGELLPMASLTLSGEEIALLSRSAERASDEPA